MGRLDGLEPGSVFHYFEEISRIPRRSGNMGPIADYLEAFAGEHHLACLRDEIGNVVIKKPAFAGLEAAPAVILQGHIDMVCERTPESSHDFSRDPLDVAVDGDWIYARGTTLGGDDGFAVACMLAVLDDDSLVHPALEAVFTADEEIGLVGAGVLDSSWLTGRSFINMDSEEEGILTVSCAGGASLFGTLPVRYHEVSGVHMEVTVDGLLGGHSGAEIHCIRGNSNILAGRVLFALSQKLDCALAELSGGGKDNAIPRATRMVLVIDGADEELLIHEAARIEAELRNEYGGTDEGVRVRAVRTGEGAIPALDPASAGKLLFLMRQMPNGVQKMSGRIQGLVETSLNFGVIQLRPDAFTFITSVRSSVASAMEELMDRVTYLTEFLGGEVKAEGVYPAWEYREDSPLRKLMVEVYEEQYGEKPRVEAIHAGLECGIFYEKLPGLDCVSLGPNMSGIHTTEEKLSISSVGRVYRYLTAVLARLGE